MGGAVVGAWWIGERQWFYGLLAFLVLWGSLGPYFVTARFVIDAAGVEVASPFVHRRQAWDRIHHYYVDGRGATLTPLAGASWLEPYRAVRLLFGDRESEVRRRLHERLGEPHTR